jgi:hypothetical protein
MYICIFIPDQEMPHFDAQERLQYGKNEIEKLFRTYKETLSLDDTISQEFEEFKVSFRQLIYLQCSNSIRI